jgi:hypothetical protein
MTEPTPLITAVDFVCLPAQDFDALTACYGETLGLPFLKRYGDNPLGLHHRYAPVDAAAA